jgi:hypothetical protein
MPRHATIHALVVLLAACTGLDPGAFQAKKSSSSDPEAAGWSFDAGPTPDGGRDGGTGGAGRASSGAPSAGRGEPGEGGAAGESVDGGSAGAMPERGGAGMIRGGSGAGGAGGRGGNGGLGGRLDSGGASGRGAGGAAGGVGAGPSGGAGMGQGGAAVHAFLFSEYVEGSSSYKALEITAREPSTFAGCRLVTYFNGSSSGSGIALDGSLSSGGTYVLCSTSLATLVGSACHRATNLTFNGDDALALECDGMLLDVIGQIGVDPGDGWGTGDASTLNHTLRRSCASSSGDRDGSDSFEPASEWSAFPADTFDGLGQTECAGG